MRRKLVLVILLTLAFVGLVQLILSPTMSSALLRSSNSPPLSVAKLSCGFFMAESSLPRAGLGVYTALPLAKGDFAQPSHDLVLNYFLHQPQVHDNRNGMWTWQGYHFGAQFLRNREEGHVYAATAGIVTLNNNMNEKKFATHLQYADPDFIFSNGGLERQKDPGAGAITHFFGATTKTLRDVEPGSELLLHSHWMGPKGTEYQMTDPPTTRSPSWLARHGMCIDHIVAKQASDPGMGRGAFAKRSLPKGTIVAPSPLQIFESRELFAATTEYEYNLPEMPEDLFVNYCFQPTNSTFLIFPYGQGVGLINHNSDPSRINVKLQWSANYMNKLQWLDPDISLEQFWKMYSPGSTIIEAVATKDIAQGDEIFMSYGPEWEEAWNEHVRNWSPPPSSDKYVYAQDMDLSEPFRTVDEQQENPYPSNLMIVYDYR